MNNFIHENSPSAWGCAELHPLSVHVQSSIHYQYHSLSIILRKLRPPATVVEVIESGLVCLSVCMDLLVKHVSFHGFMVDLVHSQKR